MRTPAKRLPCGLAIVALLAASLVFAADAAAPSHTDPGRFYDKANGFSLVPPAGWTRTDKPAGEYFVLFMAPAPATGFRTNLNVIAKTTTGNESVQDTLPKVKKGLAAAFKDFKAVDEGKLEINGRKAAFLCSTFTLGNIAVENLQYFIDGGNKKKYTITFTAAQSSFAAARPTFEKCALTAVTD
jgi:hypothetical protein